MAQQRVLWSETAHETAAALWSNGSSGTEVATALAERHGLTVTRSAVICRMRRAGVPQGESEERTRQRRDAQLRRTVLPSHSPMDRMVAPAPARLGLARPKPSPRPEPDMKPGPEGGVRLVETRERQCRFIAGPATADARCCGAETRQGSSWCRAHERIVWRR